MSFPDLPIARLIALLRDGDVTEAVVAAIDWPAVIRCAHEHEVAPLLYRRLAALPARLQPEPELMVRLHAVYLHGAARNLRVAEELRGILTALNAAGVPVIPLKGAHLAFLTYADPAERVMGDLDLLIHPEDVPRAREALSALDYAQFGLPHGESSHNEHFQRPGGMPIEVHRTLGRADMPVSSMDCDAVWARALPAMMHGVPARVLCPADHLVYLCLHVHYHGFRVGLRRMLDIREIVRVHGDQLDWAEVRTLSREWRCMRPVALVLTVVCEWFATALPVDTVDWITGEGAGDHVAQAQQVILGTFSAVALPDCFVRMTGRRGLFQKVRTGFSAIFLPRNALALRYGIAPHSPWLPWYYVRRIGDFITRWGGQVLGMRHAFRALSADTARRSALLDWVDGQR
jgi:hypothetical protein